MDNFIAIFGVQQNTANLEKQLALYGHVGFVIDEGAELEHGEVLPDSWFAARAVQRSNLKQTFAMRLPGDPFMHVWFYSWNEISTTAQWPPLFNQIGSRGLTFLVDDVEKELSRISEQFGYLKVLQAPEQSRRRWGLTTSALMLDPEGNFLELMSIAGSPQVQAATPPPNSRASFLHFMMNSFKFEEMSKFYRSFGMEHDSGVDFRPGVGWPDGRDFFMNQYKEGYGAIPKWGQCHFLRGKRDPSHMHLELLEIAENDLRNPGLNPTWAQKGISRYCIKVPDYDAAVRGVKQRGNKIIIEQQKACLNWGDSIWIFFGDVDGNILTLEEWRPQRYWGEQE